MRKIKEEQFRASPKHLSRYVDEFTFRLNQGNVARHTLERLDSFIDATVGKRITYQELIAEVAGCAADIVGIRECMSAAILNP